MVKIRWRALLKSIVIRISIIFLLITIILQANLTANNENSIMHDTQQGCSTEYSDDSSDSKDKDESEDKDEKSSKGEDIPNKENIKKIYEVLHDDYGLSAELIAGIVSNWITESQLDPTSNEPGNSGEKSAKSATDGE